MADGWYRVAAAGSAGCVIAGSAAVVHAIVNGPGPGPTGYVSEAGVAGSRYALAYRLGLFGVAAALLLLAVALRPAARRASPLLVASAVLTVLSGVVTCTGGCPLPPFQPATVADLVHGAASVAAVACCVFAILAVALSPPAGPLRRPAAYSVGLALPLSAAIGLAMLLLGRGPVVGVLERLLLAELVLWAVTTAVAIVCQGAGPGGTRPVGSAARAKDRS